jgi:methylglyoxal synthase
MVRGAHPTDYKLSFLCALREIFRFFWLRSPHCDSPMNPVLSALLRLCHAASITLRNPALEAQTAGQIIEYRGNYDAVPSEWCQLAVLQEADKTLYRDQSDNKGNHKSNTELQRIVES